MFWCHSPATSKIFTNGLFKVNIHLTQEHVYSSNEIYLAKNPAEVNMVQEYPFLALTRKLAIPSMLWDTLMFQPFTAVNSILLCLSLCMKSAFGVLLNETMVTDALQVRLSVFYTIWIWLERMAVVWNVLTSCSHHCSGHIIGRHMPYHSQLQLKAGTMCWMQNLMLCHAHTL